MGHPQGFGSAPLPLCNWQLALASVSLLKAEVLADSDYLSLSRYLEFFSIYITDICQTSESFAKSVDLKKEWAKRTIPSVEATGVLR